MRRGVAITGPALVVVLVLGVLGIAAVVFASAGGPVRPVSESTLRNTEPRQELTYTPSATAPTNQPATPKPGDNRPMPEWLKTLWLAFAYALAAVVAGLLVYLLVRMLRGVRLPPAEPEDPEWERLKSQRLAEAVESGLAAVDEGDPADGVIACWVALEQAAASAGAARDPAETPAEFTVRVLGVGGISEPELVRLAELYREARYSTHGSSEAARVQARAALVRLRDELAAAVEQ